MSVSETDKLERLRALKVGDRVKVTGQFMIERSDLNLEDEVGTVTEADEGGLWVRLDDEYQWLEEWDNSVFINLWGLTLDSNDPLPDVSPCDS